MNFHRICAIVFSGLVVFCSPVAAQMAQGDDNRGGDAGRAYTGSGSELVNVVRDAIESHPDIVNAVATLRGSQHTRRAEYGNFLPRIDLQSRPGYALLNNRNTRLRLDGPAHDTFRHESSVTVRQLIFDGGGTRNRVRAADQNIITNRHLVDAAAEAIGLEAAGAFIAVVRAQQNHDLADENLNDHTAILRDIRRREGVGTRVDTTQAEGRTALARSTLSQQTQQLRDSEARFLSVVGRRPGRLNQTDRPENVPQYDINDMISVALLRNPDLNAAGAAVDRAEFLKRATNAPFYPQVNLELTAFRNDDVNGTEGKDLGFRALAVINWNLYNGGADTARKRAAIENIAAAKGEKGGVERDVRERVETAFNSFVESRNRLRFRAEHVNATQRVYQDYTQQFLNNRGRTLLDLLDTRNELFRARVSYNDEQQLFLFAHYQLLAAVGVLSETLGIDVEQLVHLAADN